MKWRVELSSGVALRAAVRAAANACGSSDVLEKRAAVLDALQKCLAECIEELPERKTEAYRELQSVIDGEADLIRSRSPLIQEMGFETSKGLVVNRLEQFYDLCDQYGVWINMSRAF